MDSRVIIEPVKDSDNEESDKVFLVTVNVEYSKTPQSQEKYNIELQSLKVIK